jgi:group I intron endonuclease
MKYHYVYITTNLINGKQYIGDRSCDCLPEDDNYLGSGRPLFKDAKKKYGAENFKKEVLEIFETREEAHKAEEKYIKLFKTHVSEGGYNLNKKGGKSSINEETRKKISRTSKNRKHSEQTKQKIKNSHLGKKFSEEHKQKLRNLKSEEHKEKMKEAWVERRKIPVSEETKIKISEAGKGKERSQECKYNIGLANSNRIWKDESREKIRQSRIGKKLSEETKMKIGKKYKCRYCGAEMNAGNLSRYHNENCKFKNIS